MALAVGQIVDGVVTNILKFGAFVNLPEGKSGLVHISEVSDSYVENINDFLKKGQEVKVKVLSIDEKGKIDLSMKQAQKKSTKPAEFEKSKRDDDASFEDKLSKFLKDSNEKFEQARSRENSKMAGQRRNK
ncbi:S1 RNA binding domain protein [Anaerosphaera aminiphila DSM 21120]|uniref:S1 RNA binding domain protein n=1 Tax=Anaerosphaera aminiphila DSM 21120 TaxID=1120995 RepID=A0A1M5R1Q4_9FIRM|nr:S1 RNA-binding domain-containing protein [Anaerosphaera aminiphila]SHH19970.1 S1 RNA binding domain protein [Anaerosphaera aminiphila DSM 21120]